LFYTSQVVSKSPGQSLLAKSVANSLATDSGD